ncbi:Microcephalin [Trichoplax sp. H2]|nr:Microcephalin [Trichoplax sp. H2]|eukprot:RDD41310.1 Microcephalin [Trichoplax sp. H2]
MLPHQQQVNSSSSGILSDVVAYVEVRSSQEDRSASVNHQLMNMGAEVVNKLSKRVTHIVYKTGKKSTVETARKNSTPLLNVLWVDSCKQSSEKVSIDNFIINYDDALSTSTNKRLRPTLEISSSKRSKVPPGKDKIEKQSKTPVSATSSESKLQKRTTLEKENKNTAESTPKPKKSLSLSKKSWKKQNGTPSASFKPASIAILCEETQDISLQVRQNNFRVSSSAGTPSQPGKPIPVTPDESSGGGDAVSESVKSNESEKSSLNLKRRLNFKETVTTGKVKKARKITKTTDVKEEQSNKESQEIVAESVCMEDGGLSSQENNALLGNTPSKFPGSRRDIREVLKKTKKVKRPKEKVKKHLVLSCMQLNDRKMAQEIVDKLGLFKIIESVDEKTTHVVTGTSRRTLNVIYAMLRGCWVLSIDWLFHSICKERWADEREFQLADDFPALQKYRLEDRSQSESTLKNLFSSYNNAIYVCKRCQPPRDDIINILNLCSIKTSNTFRNAALVIGNESFPKWYNVPCVSERWILDSICQGRLLPKEDYLKDLSQKS